MTSKGFYFSSKTEKKIRLTGTLNFGFIKRGIVGCLLLFYTLINTDLAKPKSGAPDFITIIKF